MCVRTRISAPAGLVPLEVQTVRRRVGELMVLIFNSDRMAPRSRLPFVGKAAHFPV